MKKLITGYTVGFMFNNDMSEIILLLRKSKPKLEWMAGKWNGVGGHIEEGETPAVCMAREFEEEAGIKTNPEDWTEFAILAGDDYDVYCFFTHYDDLNKYIQAEEQKVSIFSTKQESFIVQELDVYPRPSYHEIPVMPNLTFLIPLAMNCAYLQKPVWFFNAVGDGSHD